MASLCREASRLEGRKGLSCNGLSRSRSPHRRHGLSLHGLGERTQIWEHETTSEGHDPSEGLPGSQEAGASLQLVFSGRTGGLDRGAHDNHGSSIPEEYVHLEGVIHGRMPMTEPSGGSRNQVRCVQQLRAPQWLPRARFPLCRQSLASGQKEHALGWRGALHSQQGTDPPTWRSTAW